MRRVEAPDLPRLVAANPRWREDELRRRLDEGQIGFLWESDGRFVHCRWASTSECWLPYLGHRLRPGPRRVIAVEAFTVSGERRAGRYRESLDHFLDWAEREGAVDVVFFVAWWHRPVLAALRGDPAARPIGAVTRLLGRRRAEGRITLVAPGVLGVDEGNG